MVRARPAFSSRLAIGTVRTLNHMSTIRVVRCPKIGDAVEISAEIGRWVGDKVAWVEVIAPRVIIDSVA